MKRAVHEARIDDTTRWSRARYGVFFIVVEPPHILARRGPALSCNMKIFISLGSAYQITW